VPGRRDAVHPPEQHPVMVCDPAARRVPSVEVRQLYPENGRFPGRRAERGV